MGQVQFFYGEEGFLIEEAVQAVSQKYDANSKELFQEKFELSGLSNAVSMVSLFSQSKVILIKNPWFLTETLNDKEFNILKTILEACINSANVMVIYMIGKKIDQRRKAVTYMKKNAETQEFQSFKDWEQNKVMEWIKQRVTSIGKRIGREALFAIEELGGTNLRYLAGEINKLATYTGNRAEITREDIAAVSAGANASIFQFSEALRIRDKKKVMSAVNKLFANNEDPIRLMGLVVSNIRLYYQILELLHQKADTQSMGRELAKNPYYLQKLIPDIRKHYTIDSLKQAFIMLNNRDFEIKTGKLKPRTALELALMEICG
ncbi:DNA polymerase III subunit delta [Thermoproteota archaeon]